MALIPLLSLTLYVTHVFYLFFWASDERFQSCFSGTATRDTLGFIGTAEGSDKFLMGWGHQNVHYTGSFTFIDVLNVQNRGYVVIVLVHNSNTNPTGEQFKTYHRPLMFPLYDLLIDNAIDVAIVKGNQAPLKCLKLIDIFEVAKAYFKPHVDISTERGKSYSFCSKVIQPYMQSHFHVTQSSKGLENICPGINVDLVQELPGFAGDRIDKDAVKMFDICEGSESSLQIKADRVKKYLFQESPDAECRADDQDMSTKVMKNSATRKRKRNMMNDPTFSDEPWKTTANFRESWLKQIKDHQKDLIPLGEVRKIKNWFEYLPGPTGREAEGRYRCRICNTYSKTLGYSKNLFVPDIAKDDGVLKPTKKENRDELTSHPSSPIHTAMVNTLMSSNAAELQDLRQYEPGTLTPGNAVTNRVMR